jgi:hypothetical protein
LSEVMTIILLFRLSSYPVSQWYYQRCRRQMHKIVQFLRDYVPGYEECYLIRSLSIIGVRETRHFKGERTLTEQDILEARVFDDWAVTRASFNFDVHNISGSGLDATGVQKKIPPEKGIYDSLWLLCPAEG